MKPEEFEASKRLTAYDEFFEKVLEYDNLTLEDYKEFMPVIFEIVPRRKEKDPLEMY